MKLKLFDILYLFVGQTAIVGILLLYFGIYTPLLAIGFGLTIIGGQIFLFRIKPNPLTRSDIPIIIIITALILIRLPASIYLSGGQDQGLYTNMAQSFADEGDLFPNDEFRNKIENSSLLPIYEENRSGMNSGIARKEDGDNIMPFYPMHPLVMSLFTPLPGRFDSSYAMLAISISTITVFYNIGTALTRKKTGGYILAGLLGINPLFLFLSKFPTTEVSSLFFSSLSFLFVLRFIESKNNSKRALFFYGSLLFLLCFFLTRLSFLVYIPLIFGFIYFALLNNHTSTIRKWIFSYFVGVWVVIIFGSIFYFNYAFELLFKPNLDPIFTPLFGSEYRNEVILLSFLSIVLLFVVDQSRSYKSSVSKILIKTSPWVIITLSFLALLGGAYYSYKVGFTDIYSKDSFMAMWNMSGRRYSVVRFSPLVAMVVYISPILIVYSILQTLTLYKQKLDMRLLAMNFTFIFFVLFCVFVVKYTAYHFYYARYYVTEIVPIALTISTYLIVKGLNCDRKLFINIAKSALVLTICYFTYFDTIQIGRAEGSEKDFFKELDSQVEQNDLLIINHKDLFPTNEVVTSLNYFFNMNTINIKQESEIKLIMEDPYSTEEINDIYVLAMYEMDKDYLSKVETLNFKFNYFSNCNRHLYSFLPTVKVTKLESFGLCEYLVIPTQYVETEKTLYLYKVDKSKFNTTFIDQELP